MRVGLPWNPHVFVLFPLVIMQFATIVSALCIPVLR